MVQIELGDAARAIGEKDRQAVAVVVGEGLLVAVFELGASGDQPRSRWPCAEVDQRLGSMCFMAARLGWFARSLLIKITLRRQWFVLTRLLLHRGCEYPY